MRDLLTIDPDRFERYYRRTHAARQLAQAVQDAGQSVAPDESDLDDLSERARTQITIDREQGVPIGNEYPWTDDAARTDFEDAQHVL